MASLDAVKTPAICFDIDGVFKAGRFFFADGLKALATAKAKGCPVCFVTNGGGGLGESEYLAGLKKKIATAASEEDREARMQGGVSSLDLLNSISDNAMILSYTPMGEAEQFKEQKVLLVGDPREKVETVARSYGWNFVHVTSYCGANPTVDPFAAARGQSHTAVANEAAPRPASPARGDFADRRAACLRAVRPGECEARQVGGRQPARHPQDGGRPAGARGATRRGAHRSRRPRSHRGWKNVRAVCVEIREALLHCGDR